jgi:hypothetical protein
VSEVPDWKSILTGQMVIQKRGEEKISCFKEFAFIHFPPVSTTPVVHLELQISPRIFEKFETALKAYPGALGKLIHEKNQKSKIS